MVDETLSPGESWRFLATNYLDPAGTSPPPVFRLPGQFANTAPCVVPYIGTENILAYPVPEPGVLALVAFAGLGLRPRRRA